MNSEPIRRRLQRQIDEAHFPNYIYGYPPKRAYRELSPPGDMEKIWRRDDNQLNIYLHIPFCNYRCTFCTLFLTTAQTDEMVSDYVEAVERQIDLYAAAAGRRTLTSIYLGGGTPTVLSPAQFERIFGRFAEMFPDRTDDAEISVEGTPDTMTPEILACLRELGVNRISMGIQSFSPEEMRRAGRRYPVEVAEAAITNIREAGFENFNLDLIYGLEDQGMDTWSESLDRALSFRPTTITLYPAVFRPLSGIAKLKTVRPESFAGDRIRYRLYDHAVGVLADEGYRQESFVRFSRWHQAGYAQEESDFEGVPLLGLGAGARTYCGITHYTTDYAVKRRPTLEIIRDYIERQAEPERARSIEYGFRLNDDELRRRYVILNLLVDRFDLESFRRIYGADASDLFRDELEALEAESCVEIEPSGHVRLTRKGFKYSNLVGALFYSPAVRELEESYTPR